MTATLGVSPYSNWQALAQLLKALGCSLRDNDCPEGWYVDEQPPAEGPLLLAYDYPHQALVNAMESGCEPTKALEHWEKHTQALLALYKANRSRAVLVNVQQAVQSPEQFANALSVQWNEDISQPGEQVLIEDKVADPYLELIAKFAIHQHPRLKGLLAQLEACTLPVDDKECSPEPVLNIDTLFHGMATLRKHSNEFDSLTLKRKALKEESQQLTEQLHLVQEELEQNLQVVKAERGVSASLRAEVASLKTAQAKIDEDQKRRATELDKLRTTLKAAETELQQKRDEVSELKRERDQVSQHSQQGKAALEEENKLVIEQLHLVQEQLESELIRKQTLQNQLKMLSQEQDHALAAANSQVNRLQNELNRIKSSTAWKAAAPVRAISRPFKKTPPEKRKLKNQAEQLSSTHYFDENWYLKTYPDVAESEANPAEHYLKFGAQEGRNPGPEFDTQWYVKVNPDVQEFGINPLIHFLNHGEEEGRAPNPRIQGSLPSPQEEK